MEGFPVSFPFSFQVYNLKLESFHLLITLRFHLSHTHVIVLVVVVVMMMTRVVASATADRRLWSNAHLFLVFFIFLLSLYLPWLSSVCVCVCLCVSICSFSVFCSVLCVCCQSNTAVAVAADDLPLLVLARLRTLHPPTLLVFPFICKGPCVPCVRFIPISCNTRTHSCLFRIRLHLLLGLRSLHCLLSTSYSTFLAQVHSLPKTFPLPTTLFSSPSLSLPLDSICIFESLSLIPVSLSN